MKGLLFTYALTYGGAVFALYRPFYGLLIYICFAIIRPQALWHWSVPAGNYSRIVAIALLIGWALHGFGNWRMGKERLVVWCLCGYWAWALASTLAAAIFPELGFQFLENMAKIVLPFIVGITLIDNLKQVKQLAWVMALSVAYVAFELNMTYYGGFNQLAEIGFASMDNNSVAIELVAAVGFLFFLGFAADKWWHKVVAAVSVLVLINAIMFSFSRGGLLSLIITAFVSFILIPKKAIHYGVFVAAVAAGIRLAGPQVLERFSSTFADSETRDASAQSRLDLWAQCWDVMQREPVFGLGPDHFGYYANVWYGWPMGKEAHSLWFQTGAELGFIGLGFLLFFYLLTLWYLWPLTKRTFRSSEPGLQDIARMVIASLAGFIVSSQFVSLEGLEMPYYVVMLGVGTLKVLHQESAELQFGPRAHYSHTPHLAVA
jgi:probable O-glycosylation ligase (exosortase A-associated)